MTPSVPRPVDQTHLQIFWKKSPPSGWAGSLWWMLSEELAAPGSPHRHELDEVGGSDEGLRYPGSEA